jgi:glycosyltransferase involved in cell wall biosynthesis
LSELEGITPLVVSRSSPHRQYVRDHTVFVDYPNLGGNRVARKLIAWQQRLWEWQHPRHKPYCERVARAIREAGMARGAFVLSNDPELAVFLREWFPDAFILHHAQNANTTTPRFRKAFASAVNVATACSDYAARWNENYFGFPANSIVTLYNGADVDAYVPRQDWAAEKLTVNFVGKTDPIKGPDILLKAACVLARRTKAFRIQIVGRKYYDRDDHDDYQAQLTSLAKELEGLGVEVRFTGWIGRNELPMTLGSAHIHVVPSRWDEPSALTIYEGMACGMATIGSRTGGTPEIIAEHGFLFERNDCAQLADCLERLVRDRGLCRDYGERARRRAEELSWETCWQKLKSLLPLSDNSVEVTRANVAPPVRMS